MSFSSRENIVNFNFVSRKAYISCQLLLNLSPIRVYEYGTNSTICGAHNSKAKVELDYHSNTFSNYSFVISISNHTLVLKDHHKCWLYKTKSSQVQAISEINRADIDLKRYIVLLRDHFLGQFLWDICIEQSNEVNTSSATNELFATNVYCVIQLGGGARTQII